jgi:hypothetical protein
MPQNKTPRALKLSTKCFFFQKSPNVSKLSKIVKNNFNLSFPQKQPCFDTMLEIDTTSIKNNKNDKNTNFQQTFHPT